MGNAVGFRSDAGGHNGSDVSSRQNIAIDLNGDLRQCQAIWESIEQQTTSALAVLESQHETISFLRDQQTEASSQKSPSSAANYAISQLEKTQMTLTHQMKALRSAGESFKQLVQPFRDGIYPVNLKLPHEGVLEEKDRTILAVSTELNSFKAKHDALQREVREKEALKQANDALKTEATDLKNNIESVKRINISFQKETEKHKHERDTLRTKYNSLSVEIENLKRELTQLKTRNRVLEQESVASNRRSEDLRKKLELQRKRKLSVQVQLFSPRKGDLTTMVLHEMSAMLETQCSVEDRILTLSVCENYSDIQPGVAVLILCINASRLGSDVASALQGLTLNKCQGLIILHHKDTHALPNQPSERLLTSSTSDYKKLGGIFDMAFLSGKGIYPCEMNNRTVSELVNFIKAVSPAQ